MVAENSSLVVRVFDAGRDCPGVAAVESICEVGSTAAGKVALFTDLLGDPVCRVRHCPAFLMLVPYISISIYIYIYLTTFCCLPYLFLSVASRPFFSLFFLVTLLCSSSFLPLLPQHTVAVAAERTGGAEGEIVGVIRGCVKTVTCGRKTPRNGKPAVPLYTKLAYIVGLRVSPSHRRMGVATQLVNHMEEWFRENGAEYAYMATEKDNEASLRLFTGRCGYSKFRTPSILVQPVFAHRLRVPRRVSILRLAPADSESLYRRRFSTVEFFPRDIDAVLNNPLSLGTFMAVAGDGTAAWAGADAFLADPPASWAVLSVWNCKEVFRLELRGASVVKRGLAKTTRLLDRAFPWLRIPSVPDLFRPFGLYFLYGVGGQGPESAWLLAALCAYAHNMARDGGCGVVATEVAGGEPLSAGIPHWRRLSCAEDLWCMKRLNGDYSDGAVGDWTKSPPGPSIFVDPREV